MTWEEFVDKFNKHCLLCKNLMCESWCIRYGSSGCNPYIALEQCEKENFEKFDKILSEQ